MVGGSQASLFQALGLWASVGLLSGQRLFVGPMDGGGASATGDTVRHDTTDIQMPCMTHDVMRDVMCDTRRHA